MKRLFNILVCVCTLALASCIGDGKVKENAINTPSEEKGALMLNIATRTESGTKNPNYILSIYKNEGGKSTIVRKYDSSREDMQKPEYIWLLEGNYTAVVESGTIVNASFDATEYYFGEANFDIKAGTTSTVDIVAVMQNIPVEVLFDQTIIDGFLDGFYVKVSANSDIELTYKKSQTGYFIMPEGTKTLSWNFVGTFEYEDGEQVAVNQSGTLENVAPKKSYKLSFKFSKDQSGFLGPIVVDIDESIEERDDHISFNPDPELRGVGFDLAAPCNYAGGERQYVATSPVEFVGVSIVAGGKEYNPVAESVAGVTLSGLNTPQLYVTLSDDFFNALSGGSQIVELSVTDVDGGEARKDLPYNLQGVKAYDKSKINLWSGVASISATVFGTPSNVEITCREGNGEWKNYAATSTGANTYTAQIDGVSAGHTYEYNLIIGGKTIGTSCTFTTQAGVQIPNGDMEIWCKDADVIYPGVSKNNKYWDTGNEGTSMVGETLTSSSTDIRPGSKGKYSAFLDSKTINAILMTQFGAGNIFIGDFGEASLNPIGATVYFGKPFEYNAKPKGVKFWVKYKSGAIDNVGSVGAKGDPDLIKIFCCLSNSSHLVDSTKAATTTFSPSEANIKNTTDDRYKKVLYYAYFESLSSKEEWHEMYLPFSKVDGVDPNTKATHLIFTATCSGYGDYFTGSSESWMYIDDIELVY